jgi:diguanylate cyclase (GGDEF)-like protein
MDRWLDARPPLVVIVIGLGLVGLFAVLGFLIGYEISFSVFYTIPIAAVAWYSGRRAALLVSAVSAAAWHLANQFSGQTFSVPAIPYWNAATRFGYFVIIVLLLTSLRQTLQREHALSRTDQLTGVSNRRAFLEAAQSEYDRARRSAQPLSLAYLDLDNFKAVNDQFGHDTGDQLLRLVAQILRQELRAVDLVARLGGDEFALLLTAAGDTEARRLIERVRGLLLEAMRARGWPVSFSIGVLACPVLPPTVNDMIRRADELMYTAKSGGKDRMIFASFQG